MPADRGQSYHWEWQSGAYPVNELAPPARSLGGLQGEWVYSPIHTKRAFVLGRWWWAWGLPAGLIPVAGMGTPTADDDEDWGAWRPAPKQRGSQPYWLGESDGTASTEPRTCLQLVSAKIGI